MSRPDPAMNDLGYARAPLDHYETPPDVGTVLTLDPLVKLIKGKTVWEPAAGKGALLPYLQAAKARKVITSDIHDYGTVPGLVKLDLLSANKPLAKTVVTNPPYVLVHEIAEKLIDWLVNGKIDTLILLVRATWSHGATRNWMMQPALLAHEVRLSWRPRWIADSTGSPRHDYMWLAWSTAQSALPSTVHYVKRVDPILVKGT